MQDLIIINLEARILALESLISTDAGNSYYREELAVCLRQLDNFRLIVRASL
jgi:hypothetical protein